MASYTVDFARTATTVADTPDVLTFTRPVTTCEVVNHDSAAFLWVSLGDDTVAVDGVNSVPVLPKTSWVYHTNSIRKVNVLASSAVKYTVLGNSR